MECEEVRPHLSAYVDGFLDPQIKSYVEEHVSTCKSCRQSLESLQVLVQELSDLKQVKAPDDFLEQVHIQMTKKSIFHTFMKKMFAPLRVKIPYPFTTAAAMAVLIFFIIHTPQMKKEKKDFNTLDEVREREEITDSHEMSRRSQKIETLGPTPDISKTKQLRDQNSKSPFAESAHAIKIKRTVPNVKGSSEVPDLSETLSFQKKDKIKAEAKLSADKAVEVVELYLKLKTDIPSDDTRLRPNHDRGIITSTEKDRPNAFPHSDDRTVPISTSHNMKQNILDQYQLKTNSAEMAEKPLEKSFTADGAFSNLKHIIGTLNGNILSAEYDQNTGQPKFLDAEIPSDQYGLFCDKLHELGTPQSPLPEIETRGIKCIRIRIRLIQS